MKRKYYIGLWAAVLTVSMITSAGIMPVQAADVENVFESTEEEKQDGIVENVDVSESTDGVKNDTDVESDDVSETAIQEQQTTAFETEEYSDMTDEQDITETELFSTGEDFSEAEYTDCTQDTSVSGVTGVEGQLYVGQTTSNYVNAEITNEIVERITMDNAQKQSFRLINLSFGSDAIKDVSGNTTFKVRFKFFTEDETTPIQQQITMGNCYYKYNNSARNGVYNSTDNSWQSNFGGKTVMYGESAETFSCDYYCIYKNKGKMIRYVIHIVRNGWAGVQHQPLYNEKKPASVDWVYNEGLDLYMADIRELDSALNVNNVIKYDSDGKPNGQLRWELSASTDSKEDFYVDEKYLYAKKAGQYSVFKASWAGADYDLPVRFTYDIYERAPSELLKLQTDGIASMNDYGTADSFAAQFADSYKGKAKAYYELVTALQNIRDNTENGSVRGDWDYSIRNNKAWNDTCESAQLDVAKSLAKEVWKHIFGLKEAEDKIIAITKNQSVSEEKQAELNAVSETYIAKLQNSYAKGMIHEKADVEDILEEAQQKVDKIVPPMKPVNTPTPPLKPTNTPAPSKPPVTVKPSMQKPALVRSLKVSARKGRKIKISWKRDKKVNGYQIEVATDKKFKHIIKKATIKQNKITTKTISGLKNKKKYYIRIRCVKKLSGKNVYGKWSGIKSVKVRK